MFVNIQLLTTIQACKTKTVKLDEFGRTSFIEYLLRLEEKRPIGCFLLAGLQFCGKLDFWICVLDILTFNKNSVAK